jgi:hypothetical protein
MSRTASSASSVASEATAVSEAEPDYDAKLPFEVLFDMKVLLAEIVRLLGGGDGEENAEFWDRYREQFERTDRHL